jgi:copper(I)-binding protein
MNQMIKPTRLILAAFLLCNVTLGFSDSNQVEFEGAWIKQLPPVVPMRAGYVAISNESKTSVSIVAAQSDAFELVEMHETLMADGMMKMVQRESIELPARSKVELKPGGAHLMLITPKRNLAVGDKVAIEVSFDDNTTRKVEFEVRP